MKQSKYLTHAPNNLNYSVPKSTATRKLKRKYFSDTSCLIRQVSKFDLVRGNYRLVRLRKQSPLLSHFSTVRYGFYKTPYFAMEVDKIAFMLPGRSKSGSLLSSKQLSRRNQFVRRKSWIDSPKLHSRYFAKFVVLRATSRAVTVAMPQWAYSWKLFNELFTEANKLGFRFLRSAQLQKLKTRLKEVRSQPLTFGSNRSLTSCITFAPQCGPSKSFSRSRASGTELVYPLPRFYDFSHTREYVRLKYRKFTRSFGPQIHTYTEHLNARVHSLIARTEFVTMFCAAHWLAPWYRLSSFYSLAVVRPHLDLYIRIRKAQAVKIQHYLAMRFNGHRLIITLLDKLKMTPHFFISTGLLVRYFKGRKSLRKNRSMKLLLARFMRKILIVLGLADVRVLARGVPLFLEVFLAMLFRPLGHPFSDPMTGSKIDETQNEPLNIGISGVDFHQPKPFGYQKQKKKGRIKRKIRRKLTRLNRIID